MNRSGSGRLAFHRRLTTPAISCLAVLVLGGCELLLLPPMLIGGAVYEIEGYFGHPLTGFQETSDLTNIDLNGPERVPPRPVWPGPDRASPNWLHEIGTAGAIWSPPIPPIAGTVSKPLGKGLCGTISLALPEGRVSIPCGSDKIPGKQATIIAHRDPNSGHRFDCRIYAKGIFSGICIIDNKRALRFQKELVLFAP